MKREQLVFGLLILAQAAHSIEEYFGRLWESFPPAYFVTGLVSADRKFGFLALNVALVTFGVWCYLFPVLRRWRSTRAIALGWALVECINGVGHPLWSLRQRAYTPGLVTAPILLALSLLLFAQVRKDANMPGSRV
jgi:uncharacterized protein with HXXEE motif